MIRRAATAFLALCLPLSLAPLPAHALDYEDYPVVRLRTLDKITARTMTFEAKVGATMKFGEIFIKVQTCRKPPPVQKTEASAFLQIWETDSVKNNSHWIFSGWMFSSSPTLSAMDHPVYDVWVIDCLGKDPEALPPPEEENAEVEGALPAGAAQPELPPAEQLEQKPEATEPIPEETVPTSNMPSDAAPVETEPSPEDTDSGVEVNPSAVPQTMQQQAPQPDPVQETPQEAPVAPVAPAPEQIDGIY
jgi:hypothetical protein